MWILVWLWCACVTYIIGQIASILSLLKTKRKKNDFVFFLLSFQQFCCNFHRIAHNCWLICLRAYWRVSGCFRFSLVSRFFLSGIILFLYTQICECMTSIEPCGLCRHQNGRSSVAAIRRLATYTPKHTQKRMWTIDNSVVNGTRTLAHTQSHQDSRNQTKKKYCVAPECTRLDTNHFPSIQPTIFLFFLHIFFRIELKLINTLFIQFTVHPFRIM